jgi:hypothetical protein
MERPFYLASVQSRIGGASLRQRLRGQLHHGVQTRIDRFDSGQAGRHYLLRGNLSITNGTG